MSTRKSSAVHQRKPSKSAPKAKATQERARRTSAPKPRASDPIVHFESCGPAWKLAALVVCRARGVLYGIAGVIASLHIHGIFD